MRIIGAEKDLPRAYRVINELDELGANRPGGIVENFFEIDFRLLPACRIAFAPVEPVEIEQDHATEVRTDYLELRITVKDAGVDDARDRQRAVGRPENLLMQRIFFPI